MPTSKIVNNFSYPVIAADNRDPNVSWKNHRARGSAGGVDLAYPMGSYVLANSDGVIQNLPNYGTGGNTVRLKLADGRYIEYMHLSEFSRSNGSSVVIGDIIALSGNTGQSSGPHLHVHIYENGARKNLFDYFNASITTGNTMSVTTEDNDMPRIINLADGNKGIYLVGANGKRAHITTPYHVTLIQRVIAANPRDALLTAELDIVASYFAQVA